MLTFRKIAAAIAPLAIVAGGIMMAGPSASGTLQQLRVPVLLGKQRLQRRDGQGRW